MSNKASQLPLKMQQQPSTEAETPSAEAETPFAAAPTEAETPSTEAETPSTEAETPFDDAAELMESALLNSGANAEVVAILMSGSKIAKADLAALMKQVSEEE
jgi:hypothetical protein